MRTGTGCTPYTGNIVKRTDGTAAPEQHTPADEKQPGYVADDQPALTGRYISE